MYYTWHIGTYFFVRIFGCSIKDFRKRLSKESSKLEKLSCTQNPMQESKLISAGFSLLRVCFAILYTKRILFNFNPNRSVII